MEEQMGWYTKLCALVVGTLIMAGCGGSGTNENQATNMSRGSQAQQLV
jgi:hypothetical protein